MIRRLTVIGFVVLCLAAGFLPAQKPSDTAWKILKDGVIAKSDDERAKAARVLGMLPHNILARQLAEKALEDTDPGVRAAAATALGQMGATESIPKLKEALKGQETEAVFAAADALFRLNDPSAYEVYFAVLRGERKSGQGLMESQMKMLKDPKALAKMGFEQGIGFIPFASIGYGAVKMLRRDDVSPIRAAAALKLARDPDPKSGAALVTSVADDKWIVRAAVVEAIAKRDDPALLGAIVPLLTDDNDTVRYGAAAAVIRLSAIPAGKR